MAVNSISEAAEAIEVAPVRRAESDSAVINMRVWAGFAIIASVLAGVVGHIPFVIDVVGAGAASFVRRQSEAPALIGFVVLLWAIFADDGYPRDGGPEVRRQRQSNPLVWGAWVALLLLLSVLTVTWDSAANSFITLKESFFAVTVISLYLAWCCSFLPKDTTWRSGAPTKPVAQRVTYYIVAAVVTVLSVTTLPGAIFGEGVGLYLRESSEGYVALLLIPLYFDLIAGKRPWVMRAAWYAGLVAIPVIVQLNPFPSSFEPLVSWYGETTEAFIATIVISAFFDLFARFYGRPEAELAHSQ